MVRIQVSLKISMASAIHRIGWGHVVHVPFYPTGIYRYFIIIIILKMSHLNFDVKQKGPSQIFELSCQISVKS